MRVLSRRTAVKSRLAVSIALALLSAFLLDLPFPLAGPLPPWRAIFAWFSLVPLLYALLREPEDEAAGRSWRRHLGRGFLIGYLCGVLWYVLNCYWVYTTMTTYAQGVSPLGGVGILLLFSAVLGLYFGLFGLILVFLRRASGRVMVALILAPFAWAAIELLAARLTSVPWDQLGYAQVDNLWLTQLAPFTGTYGLSFVLMAVNALLAAAWLTKRGRIRLRLSIIAVALIVVLQSGSFVKAAPAPTSSYAVLMQPDLNVGADNVWYGQVWNQHAVWMMEQSLKTCTPAFAGMPSPRARMVDPPCAANTAPPGLVVWPEAQSPLLSSAPRTRNLVRAVATTAHAPFVTGMLGQDARGTYNSALFTAANGQILGRYDKIHLVPFGEYIPFRNLLFFAHKLTQQLVDLQPGTKRIVFHTEGHGFGVFICYESIFANEIRQFAQNGAQVFVNISDDGWYGNTSAPWQHLNMARMRAIENHRWILLDTNNGITTAIDPRGRVTWSAPRNRLTSLVVRYGYESRLTFYTRFGDVFAYLCGIIVIGAVVFLLFRPRRVYEKTGSRQHAERS